MQTRQANPLTYELPLALNLILIGLYYTANSWSRMRKTYSRPWPARLTVLLALSQLTLIHIRLVTYTVEEYLPENSFILNLAATYPLVITPLLVYLTTIYDKNNQLYRNLILLAAGVTLMLWATQTTGPLIVILIALASAAGSLGNQRYRKLPDKPKKPKKAQ